MNALGILPPVLMLLSCLTYVFWSQAKAARALDRTKKTYLQERQEAVYANLRDLNFEYQAGKYPEQDYAKQRDAMEAEAGRIVSEIRQLEGSAPQVPAR